MELEGGSLLEDGGVKQEAHFQPSFCQAVLAWRFSLLLLCNCLLFSSVLGVYSRTFEVLSSKVSRSQQPVPLTSDVNAMAAISHTTAAPESRPAPYLTQPHPLC